MSIRWIVNGYFRSGTTLLWDLCRKALPENGLALYEPLHPDLPTYASNAGCGPDPLHGKDLWTDYKRIPREQLRQVFACHPNRDRAVAWSQNALWDYLDRYHELPYPILLQTNRLHYELAEAGARYGAKVVHIMRHPLAVFRSIRRIYLGAVDGWRRAIRTVLYPFTATHAFETRGFCRKALARMRTQIETCPWNPGLLHAFVPAWVVANSVALNIQEEANGMVLLYDELVSQPDVFADLLGNHLALPLRADPDQIMPLVTRANNRETDRWHTLVTRWGLGAEMDEINRFVTERNVRWWEI